MNSVWVEGYEGLYKVSDCGGIFRHQKNGMLGD